jgi:hypothetical protein
VGTRSWAELVSPTTVLRIVKDYRLLYRGGDGSATYESVDVDGSELLEMNQPFCGRAVLGLHEQWRVHLA